MSEEFKQYHALLLSGCACFGSGHIGFLLSLQNARRLRFLKVIAGTSIGSIVGFMFLLGVDLKLMFKLFINHQLVHLLQAPPSSEDLGLADNLLVIASIVDILLSVDIEPNITFAELYRDNKIKFVVTASKLTSTNSYLPAYFSVDTKPDMKVLDAIRASISIPVLFTYFSYENEMYCDGALTADLPFDYLETTYSIAEEDMLAHSPIGVDLYEGDVVSSDIVLQKEHDHGIETKKEIESEEKVVIHQNENNEKSVVPPSHKQVNNNNETSSQSKSWSFLLLSLLKYTRRELENARARKHRTVYTEIEGGSSLDMKGTPEKSTYYFHKAIHTTNIFINRH